MTRVFLKQTSAALLASIVLAASSAQHAPPAAAFLLEETKWHVDGYTLVKKSFNWKGEDSASLEVFRNGRSLLKRQSHNLWPQTLKNGELIEAEDSKPLKLVDLNGDGVRDLIIRQWSGGAYCCYVYEIFSMNGNCKRLWYNNAGCAHLKVLHPEDKPVLAMEDGTFLYWRAHSLDGPRPTVYLKWNGKQFSIDRKLMQKPFDHARFDKLRQDRQDTNDTEIMFIELVYTGNAEHALKLIDGWSPKDRSDFLQSFYETFKKSPFYYKVVTLNPPSTIERLKPKS